MPLDAEAARIAFTAETAWQTGVMAGSQLRPDTPRGYAFEFIGIATAPLSTRPPWPFFVKLDKYDPTRIQLFMQVWLATARFKKSPLWAELRWTPTSGASLAIQGFLNSSHSPEDLRRAEKGVLWLKHATYRMDSRGRPSGTGNYANRAECEAGILMGLRWLADRERPLTEENLADVLDTTDRQIRRWLKEYKLGWSRLVHTARQRSAN